MRPMPLSFPLHNNTHRPKQYAAYSYTFLTRLLTCCALLLAPAWSVAERDALVDQAAQLLRTNQPQQAFDLLQPHEVKRADDKDFNLAYGIASNRIGKYSVAIMAFERVLLTEPNNAAAKTELGLTYLAVRDTKSAERLFKEAKAAGVPTNIGKAIDQYLDSIQAPAPSEMPTRWRFSHGVNFAYGLDSNVSRAPEDTRFKFATKDSTTQQIVVQESTLKPEFQKAKSSYFSLGYNANLHYTFNQNWAWNAGAGVHTHINNSRKAKRFDNHTVNASTGVTYSKERHELSLLLQTNLQYLDGRQARTGYGTNLGWTYHIDGFRQINNNLSYYHSHNHQQKTGDTYRYGWDIAYSHMLRTGMYAFVGAYINREMPENAARQDLKSENWGARAGLQYFFRPNLSASASLNYSQSRYGKTNDNFSAEPAQRNTTYAIDSSLNWAVKPNFVVSPSLGFSQSTSNLEYYSYKRRVFSIRGSYVF